MVLLSCALLAACNDGSDARPLAERLAQEAGMRRFEHQTETFRLVGYARLTKDAPVLRIYIEGDGHNWSNRFQPSDDPTPWSPIALRLATTDKSASVAWIARPCQYVAPGSDPECQVHYWTEGQIGRAHV